jgi:pseudaminic acid synthase
MDKVIEINGTKIGKGYPVYIIAEMSANHGQDFNQAVNIIHAAKDAGANAIKLQTASPDGLTIDCDNKYFKINGLPLWEGINLYNLYEKSHLPWDWQEKLVAVALELGLDCFSSPAGRGAVEFLESINIPAYKIGSSDLNDIILLEEVAKTGKPIILSTGMSTLSEIEQVVKYLIQHGAGDIALLKCTASYPAKAKHMNLKTIPHLENTFHCPIGLSDHSLGSEVSIASIALGACIIEKHLTVSRKIETLDKGFSIEPDEFKDMVVAIRNVEIALGKISYEPTKGERNTRKYRWSIFVVEDINSGEKFSENNIRSIRPGFGMKPEYYPILIGRRASRNIKRGTPLGWEHIL